MARFSPVAPAAIRVQVLPVGRIGRNRFQDILRSLQQHAALVKLADIPQLENQQLLSPKALPESSLLFNYVTYPAGQQDQQLAPYELYREPLLVLGVADGLSEHDEKRTGELKDAAAYLRERHSRVVHRHILLLQQQAEAAEGVTVLPDGELSFSLKAAMAEVAERLLVELSTYTKAMQASPTVQTPGQPAKTLQRASSRRGDERRPTSGYNTPTQNIEVSSPTGDEGSRPPSRGFGSPPPTTTNSFDQVRNASSRAANALARSDSNASNRSKNGQRASSQDRVSVHGFGPSMSHEKTKNRGKARVGIVTGHIYMMAGQWHEALRMLTEHTNAARKLSDSHWHAKGLDGILVCMLLLAWAGQGFSIPPVCFPSEQRSSFSHSAKLSVTLPTDFRPSEVAYQAALGKLSLSLPELLKHILALYRSSEGALELPSLVLCEAKVRFCDLLMILYCEGGELNGNARSRIVERIIPHHAAKSAGSTSASGLPRSLIATMLAEAQPTDEDGLTPVDHIQLLGGISSVYSSLGMERKSGMMLQEMVTKLTGALIQARKLGAAEVGIHPAASLSIDVGLESIVNVAAESVGMQELIDKLGRVYGVSLMSAARNDEERSAVVNGPFDFGNEQLKSFVLRALIAFCEASPDPKGVLRVACSLLRAAGANVAVDVSGSSVSSVTSKDEQITVATSVSRTVGVSRHLGFVDVQADYWDDFLVRGISFLAPDTSHILISSVATATDTGAAGTAGNPLLYDPNSKNHGNLAKARLPIVRGEPLTCLVTLQNPLETNVEVESIKLVTGGEDGVELVVNGFAPVTLEPLCFQKVSLSVSSAGVGDFSITGCRVKITAFRERLFSIYARPWSPASDTLVKHHGQDIGEAYKPGAEAESAAVSMIAVEAMPLLEVESTSVAGDSVMLLVGEIRRFDVSVHNRSPDSDSVISNIRDSQGILQLKQESEDGDAASYVGDISTFAAVLQSRARLTLCFDVTGKAGVSQTDLEIVYKRRQSASNAEHARVLSVPLRMTVDVALQAQNADVTESLEDGFELSFDLRNAWSKPMSYCVEILRLDPEADTGIPKQVLLSPGESHRVTRRLNRWHIFASDSNLEDAREGLLKHIKVVWRTWAGDARWGEVDLRTLTLSKQHLELIRGQPSTISLHRLDEDNTPAKLGSFITVRLRCRRRRALSGPLWAQLQSPHESRSLGLLGVPYRILPTSEDEESHVDFVLCPLVPGTLELSAVARPTIRKDCAASDVLYTERPLFIEVA